MKNDKDQLLPKDLSISVLDKILYVTWANAHVTVIPWNVLRSGCPCVVCKGDHKPVKNLIIKDFDDIHLIDSAQIGKYAVRFLWSDGHDTGIYNYRYLKTLCTCSECS
jgi:DUF971 family protein